MAVCRSCGASVLWAITEAGKKIPFDPAPTMRGNLEFISLADGPCNLQTVAPADDDTPAPFRYTSHFATCPHADDWRKR